MIRGYRTDNGIEYRSSDDKLVCIYYGCGSCMSKAKKIINSVVDEADVDLVDASPTNKSIRSWLANSNLRAVADPELSAGQYWVAIWDPKKDNAVKIFSSYKAVGHHSGVRRLRKLIEKREA